MVILDTDHLSVLDQDTTESVNLGRRLAALPEDEVTVSIITYEEQMRGWLAYVARTNTSERQIEAYRKLHRHIERFCRIPLVDYDKEAVAEYERLRQAGVRIGTMDLKIAAIALADDATLLTRNLADFNKVPGLQAEDWTT